MRDKAPAEFQQSHFPTPPSAERDEGGPDPYAWLRDPGYPNVTDPKILGYLTAENDYTEAVQAADPDIRLALLDELKARVVEDDAQVPYRYRGYYYYWRFQKAAQHRIHCRKRALDEPEEVLLDVNIQAARHAFYQVSAVRVSPDETLLAYAEDTDGSERYSLRLKNLRTGDLLAEHIAHASPSIVWTTDSLAFFYCRLDEQLRPRQVFLHEVGGDARYDELIYEENDPQFWLGISTTLAERFLYIEAAAKSSTETRFVPLDQPRTPPLVIAPRRPGHEYSATDRGGSFYIRTNDRHRNFRMVETLITATAEEKWCELIAPSDERYLIGHVTTASWWAVMERESGLTRVRVIEEEGEHVVAFPDAAYAVGIAEMGSYHAASLRLSYQSPVLPPTIYDYVVEKRRLDTLKTTIVPGYNPSLFKVERLWATARDGVKIPVTLLSRRDASKDGTAPLLLYGYGAYGYGIEPGFSASRFSLVERGMSFAIAHIRGGDELGAGWYDDGKLLNKQNTFNDFVDVAGFLVEQKITGRGRIAAMGGSAGGLLVGAVLNQAPEGLFHAALALVPFVDALNTMLDATLPLTPPEYLEWGNPAEPLFHAAIAAYSPYDNVTAKAYPHLYISAGLNDPRVTYWEPAKWAAKLRSFKTGEGVLVLKTNMAAGHGGAAGRYQRLEEVASEWAFLLKAFGLAAPLASQTQTLWRDGRR